MTPQYTEGSNPNIDLSIWTTTLHRIGGFFTSLVNEFMVAIQVIIPDDAGQVTQSYEKAAHIVEIEQHAKSDYVKNITKDACARDHRASIKSNNMTGRVWAGFDQGVVEKGADGIAIGVETNIKNDGAYQPNLDTLTSKIYHFYTKGGEHAATAVGFIEGDEVTRYGWVARQNAFTPDGWIYALLKRDSNEVHFGVRTDGSMVYQGMDVQLAPVKLVDGTQAMALVVK